MKKILILCTGNSCRSQMAAGFLNASGHNLQALSAGTQPAARVHPCAVAAMAEVGIDISGAVPRNVSELTGESFDMVITVCDKAGKTCPVFTGVVGRYLHIGFDDPAEATGTDEEIMREFRRVRDDIKARFNLLCELLCQEQTN